MNRRRATRDPNRRPARYGFCLPDRPEKIVSWWAARRRPKRIRADFTSSKASAAPALVARAFREVVPVHRLRLHLRLGG